jgi:flagellar P-ring protein precursor FlgI
MMKKSTLVFGMMLALSAVSVAQNATGAPATSVDLKAEANRIAAEKAAEEAKAKAQAKAEQAIREAKLKSIKDAEKNGIEVRIKDIARFRGVRSNQLHGFGLVIGLEGTGDSKKTPFTQQLLANALREFGTAVDATQLNLKNIATVAITAELPPFSAPGNQVDVTVQSIGDAKSLQGGYLLQAPLYAQSDNQKAYVVAQGAVSIGGFQAGANGSSVQKNHLNVGRIPEGGIVEASVTTQLVFGNKMFLEVEEADFTTAQRLATKLSELHPEYAPVALSGGSIQLTLPSNKSAVTAISEIESTTVFADIPAVVVINERTGTVVVGANVKICPAVVAKGSLQVRIDTMNDVSQPNAFSKGTTTTVSNSGVNATEDKVQVAMIAPNTTVADLARIFVELRVSATDIIAILQELKAQGALKARIKVE